MTETKKNNQLDITKKENVELVAFQRDFSDRVINSVKQFSAEKRLQLPKSYSAENALKSAWLMIQGIKDKNGQQALKICDPKTIANALLEMCIMGLNPAKNQCYFIVYGNTLSLFPSYFGKITALKRIDGVESINAQVIYKNDVISYEINSDGSIYNIEHSQEFENIKEDNIIGGYCVIKYKGQEYGTIATMEQIQEAWNKSISAKKKTEFKSEFVKRTMVNKAIKWFINTRDDEDLLIETISNNENQYYAYEEQEREDTPVIQEVVIEQEETKVIKTAKEEKNDSKVVEFE